MEDFGEEMIKVRDVHMLCWIVAFNSKGFSAIERNSVRQKLEYIVHHIHDDTSSGDGMERTLFNKSIKISRTSTLKFIELYTELVFLEPNVYSIGARWLTTVRWLKTTMIATIALFVISQVSLFSSETAETRVIFLVALFVVFGVGITCLKYSFCRLLKKIQPPRV